MMQREPAPEFNPLDLRRAFGKFASGVTVVTAVLEDGRKIGFTANSFASVSLDPPLISWNYRQASPNLQGLMASKYFLVHVLSAEQIELSDRMSRPSEDKFADLPIEQGIGGTPRLRGGLATFECERWKTVEAGDHIIFIGKVVRYDHTDGQPLVFMNGSYAQAEPRPRHTS